MLVVKEKLQKWLEKDVQELIDSKNDDVFDLCDETSRYMIFFNIAFL